MCREPHEKKQLDNRLPDDFEWMTDHANTRCCPSA